MKFSLSAFHFHTSDTRSLPVQTIANKETSLGGLIQQTQLQVSGPV